MHKVAKVYVPELIFGHLRTGSNYRDDEKRVWSVCLNCVCTEVMDAMWPVNGSGWCEGCVSGSRL